MFSLTLSIISIGLVVLIAAATLWYGGGTYNMGAAQAEAAKLHMQSRQILTAAQHYYEDHRRWPADIEELVDGKYLNAIPSAAAPGALSSAHAAGASWAVVPRSPVFFLQGSSITLDACSRFNTMGPLRADGVPLRAYTGLAAQCFGENTETLTIVVQANGTNIAATRLVSQGFPAADGLPEPDAAWLLEPSRGVR